MKFQILLSILFFPMLLSAQSNEWGIGVLKLPYDNYKTINVYDCPNGKITSTLGLENSIDDLGYQKITWRDGKHGGLRIHIPNNALIQIGYEIDGLVVKKETDGFLKIMYTEGDLIAWVSLVEIKKAGFIYYPWKQFMVSSGQTFFTTNYGMNVRQKPSINEPVVIMVKGDQFEIELTGKTKGLWAEVVIKEFDSVYCEAPHQLINTFLGWMKILDDEGYPNVWFYPRGC